MLMGRDAPGALVRLHRNNTVGAEHTALDMCVSRYRKQQPRARSVVIRVKWQLPPVPFAAKQREEREYAGKDARSLSDPDHAVR